MDDYNQYGGGPEAHYSGVPEQDLTGQILYQGNIHNTNLTDLFFLIIHERKIGILEVWDSDYRKRIHFRANGVSVTNISPPRSHYLLGNQLLEIGRITQEQLEEALTEQQTSPRLLGEIMIERGFTTHDEVMALLRRQIKQDIFEIFFWPNLEYAFYEGESLYETPHVDMRLAGMTFDTNKYVVDLANILGYLITLEHPGTLFIQSNQRQTDLFFNGQMIEFSNYREEKEVRLGEILIQKGWLSQEGLQQGLADQKASEEGGFLGEILVFRGYLSEDQVAEALREQMAQEFVSAFSQDPVNYSYLAGGPPLQPENRTSSVTIPLDLRRLVMETYVMVDDWEQFLALIPNCIGVFPYTETGDIDVKNLNLNDIAAQLNAQVNRSFEVRSISQMLAIPEFETAILLAHFVRNVLLQSAEAFQKVSQNAVSSANLPLAINALNQARLYMPWDINFLEQLVERHKLAGNKKEAAAYLYELAFLKSDESNFVQNIDAVLKTDPTHFESRQYMFDYFMGQRTSSGQADERANPHAESLFDYYVSHKQYDEARKLSYLCQEKNLDPLKFAQKVVDLYSSLNMKPELVVELRNLARLQKELKRFESEFQTLQRLRELTNDRTEIDNRVKVLRKMGIGPPVKQPVLLYTVTVLGILFLLIVGFIVTRSSGTGLEFDNVIKRIEAITMAESSFNNQGYDRAVKDLTPLAEFQGDYPEVRDAQRILKDYKQKEDKRVAFYKDYSRFKQEERWLQAFEALREVELLTPEKRQEEQKKLKAEYQEIQPFIERYQAELQAWRSQLDAYRQKIQDLYRTRTQNSENLIKVEENIQFINNVTIPKIIDSKTTRDELEASLDFARKMQENVLKRRLEIFEVSKKTLIVLSNRYRQNLESFDKTGDESGMLKLGEEYSKDYDGFIENFCKPINDNDVEKAKEPVAELYGLTQLLQNLEAFVKAIESPAENSSLGLLKNKSFYGRFLIKLRDKVKADHEKLFSKYSSQLQKLNEFVEKNK